jgi:hypothetical protein
MSGKKKKDYSKLSLDDFSDDDSEDGGGFRDEYGGKNNRNEADEFVKNQQVRRFHCCVFFAPQGPKVRPAPPGDSRIERQYVEMRIFLAGPS